MDQVYFQAPINWIENKAGLLEYVVGSISIWLFIFEKQICHIQRPILQIWRIVNKSPHATTIETFIL